MTLRLATIPPPAPFLDTLAGRWLDAHAADPSRGLLLLPTRRAARALADAFLRVSGGRPMLLPRITAIGAADEVPLVLAGALDLPPAVDTTERLAVLTSLVMAASRARGEVLHADRAWPLARDLAGLMDEAEYAEIDLASALAAAVPETYAAHWQMTLQFLSIVTRAWPDWLAEQGLSNPVARQMALLRAQAAAWQANAPDMPVWAAGFAGAPPGVAALLRIVAGLPQGLVVLPWLDPPPDGADETHAQWGLVRLLAAIGARSEEVERWGQPGERVCLLGTALLPAAALAAWREVPAVPDGLRHLRPSDQQEEAVAIAMILRDAVEQPGQRAALVTPDRALARRVCAELLRWGIVADDSAGEMLAETPPGTFLRLLAQAVAAAFAPVALLSLLKHPLCAAGMAPVACREAARVLERHVLRGPRPSPGLSALRQAVDASGEATAQRLVSDVERCLAPLLRVVAGTRAAPAEQLRGLIEAAELLAGTDEASGVAQLWGGEDGGALAEVLALALPALRHVPEQPPDVLPDLLDALLEGAVVRSRRALRGREAVAEHPAVSIWGLLEARLQAADVIVLGGLAEGVWPPAPDPGPWLGRAMRRDAGFPSADAAIGQAAHDFVAAACAAPVAILSCPLRREGAPAVPSRWLARLEALLRNTGPAAHAAVDWARRLDQPADGQGSPVPAPHPCPPVALRPRNFSISDIEALICDPYAHYAKCILELRGLAPLEQSVDRMDFGSIVHRAIEQAGRVPTTDPVGVLVNAMNNAMLERGVRPALKGWWFPRLRRIAAWLVAEEARRPPPDAMAAEHRGELVLPGDIVLRGRADRVERRPDGSVALIDYKTTEPPKASQVRDATRPQLPLEAAMAERGGFGPAFTGPVRELAFWRLSGGRVAGEVVSPLDEIDTAEAGRRALDRLVDLLAKFARPERGYPHVPHPKRKAAYAGTYAQLARAAELAAAREEE